VSLRRHALLALLGLLAAGCELGPDYARPEVPLPEDWRDISPAEQASLADKPWWELFQDPQLVQLIDMALSENKDLKIATERIEEARARYGFTHADIYPHFDAYGSAAWLQHGEDALPAGADRESNMYAVGASAFWELDFFGRIRRSSEAELAAVFATEEARSAVVLSLVSDVARAYIELVELDRSLSVSRRTLQSREEYVQLAKDRFDGGVTSELDWRQAQAEEQRTATFVQDFERQVRQKENEISFLVGRNPGEIDRGAGLDSITVPLSVPAGLPADLLERRPDVRQAEETLASSTASIGAAKALLYPSFFLTGTFGWETTDLDQLLKSPAKSWSLGANVLQPIFNAGKNQSQVEVAESLQRQALFGYESSILQAFREVEDALVGLRQFGLQRDSQRQRVEAERKVLELAELRYRGGVANYLEVLDAQRSLFESELDESTAIRDQFVAFVQLYKSLGGGWQAHETEGPPEAAP